MLFVDAGHLQQELAKEFPDASFAGQEELYSAMKGKHGALVHVAALSDANEMEALQSALYMAQAAMRLASERHAVAPMWWVTKGTQDQITKSYVHAGLWGLARTFRMEERGVQLRRPDSALHRYVDID